LVRLLYLMNTASDEMMNNNEQKASTKSE
jgi:hypothetical protein